MAVLNAKHPTLVDLASMPDMKDAGEVINLLAQFNPILMDAPAFECNDGTRHKTTVRTGLPTPTWGRLYKGIPQSKGQRQSVVDTTGFLESSAEVDTRLIDIVEKAEEKASLRLEEAEGHLEAMSQEAASAIFYHDTAVDPEKPMGFAPRFNDYTAENGGQIIDGGALAGQTDCTSIWMITWDKKASHLLYPKGSKAGIDRFDRGIQKATDGAGDSFFVYQEDFRWHLGLSVRDWRYVVRIPNIDISELTLDASSGADLVERMTQAHYKHYGRRTKVGKTMLYANTTIVKFLDFQSRRNTNVNMFLTQGQSGENAEEVLMFRGVPIRETDAILSTETSLN